VRFLALDCREALYGGAAGGGKSDALLMGALSHVHVPGYRAILFRRTHTDLALPGALMDRAHEWLAGTAARWVDRDKTWQFPSGATLTFGYLDGPRDHFRYQGAEFQFIGFDELTQFERIKYLYLFSRLRKTAGVAAPLRVRAATNPGDIGHEWVKERFLVEPGDRVFVPARIDDNPHLDQDAYRSALLELDPITRRQLLDGEWIRDTSALVYKFDRRANVVDALPQLPPGERWSHILGADFGVEDPTAYVVLAYTDHDPAVYCVRAEQWPGLDIEATARIAHEWDETHRFDAMVGDLGSLGGRYIEQEWHRRFRLPIKAAKKSDKLGYVKLLNGDLATRKLLLVRGATDELASDLENLAWKDDSHRAEHPNMPNHLTDALLYGWRECRGYDWTEREAQPENRAEAARMAANARKERIIERAKRREDNDSDDWILGPEAPAHSGGLM